MYSANFFSPCLMWFHPQSLRKQRRIWLPWKSKLLDWHGNMTGCWRSILKHRWVAREGFVIWGLLLKRFLSGGLPSRSSSPSPQMSLESSTTLGPYSWILTNVDFENTSGPIGKLRCQICHIIYGIVPTLALPMACFFCSFYFLPIHRLSWRKMRTRQEKTRKRTKDIFSTLICKI